MKKQLYIVLFIAIFFGAVTTWIANIIMSAKSEQIEMSKLMLVEEATGHYKNISALRMWHNKFGGIFEQNASSSDSSYHFSIVSLNPKNPDNRAIGFAKRGIEAFERNASLQKYYEFTNDEKRFEFIGVLKAEKFCINCHTGYRVGDIRGGIVVDVPLTQFGKTVGLINDKYSTFMLLTIIFALLTAVAMVILSFKLLRRHQEIETLNHTLEIKVLDRTKKLDVLYENEHYLRSLLNTIAVVNESLITSYSIGSIIDTSLQKLSEHKYYRLVCYSYFDGTTLMIHHKQGDAYNLVKQDSYSLIDYADDDMFSTTFEAAITQRTKLNNHIDIQPTHIDIRRKEDYTLCGAISIPIIDTSSTNLLGVLTILSSRTEGFEQEEVSLLENLAVDLEMAISAFKQRTLVEQLQNKEIMNYEETILAFVNMIEQRDAYTAGHTLRVAKYCRIIAKEMNFEENAIVKLEKSAILHDIGKIATPDTILLKPGKLNALEYSLIKNHVTAGYKMLANIEMYSDLAEIIKYHHEHYDGNGYPKGYKKDEIPLVAHVLIVADAFDAMTTNRIYKGRLSVEQSLAEIVRLSGEQFHPDVATIAARVLSDIHPDFTTQLPENELEKQRFSYFFNDNLTGLYNEHYLQMIINQHTGQHYVDIIFIKKFSKYNKEYGWNAGNIFLSEFASELKNRYSDAMIFRHHGDDFVLLCDHIKHISIRDIIDIHPLLGETIECEVLHFDLNNYEDYAKFSEKYL